MSSQSITTESSSAFHDRLNLAVGETSYRQLGAITETHPETVRRYMQGQAPSAAFMTNLCRNLGISGEWLLSGQGPMKVRDMRTHALKHADANELMGAIANTLTQLIERVDRLERFVQVIETKLNAGGMVELKTDSGTMHAQLDGSADGRAEAEGGSGSGVVGDGGGSAAERIGGVVSKRSSEHDA
ncbi:MAG: hypothetical protein ACSHX5_12830 [Phycisphaerales bacterium]